MLYPGYQDSSFFHDERGFNTATPYGDSADFLLSDAPGWLLERYPVLVVAGELSGGAEVRDKLQAYAAQGGKLFITAGSLRNLPGGLAGIESAGRAIRFNGDQQISIGSSTRSPRDNPSTCCRSRLHRARGFWPRQEARRQWSRCRWAKGW